MTGLRHAGSPVEQPETLSRAKQNALLMEVLVYSRLVARQHRCVHGHRIPQDTTLVDDVSAIRAALRLDDPVLDDLIAQGKHRGPWISEVPSCPS